MGQQDKSPQKEKKKEEKTTTTTLVCSALVLDKQQCGLLKQMITVYVELYVTM